MRPRHLVPAAALAAYVAFGLAWLGGAHRPAEQMGDHGSRYERSATGTSLAFAYLQARGYDVATLAAEVRPDQIPDDAVVFRIAPGRYRTALVEGGEHEWLRRGGRLVLAPAYGYGPLTVSPSASGTKVVKTFPTWTAVAALYPRPVRAIGAGLPPEAVTLFAAGDAPVVARWTVGRGDVVVLSCPDVLENGGLAVGDHLSLLESLAGHGRPVLFDELVHGSEGPGLMALLAEWRLAPALALAALAALLALWRNRARQGEAEDDHEETRSDAVDLVDSLALLYGRALTRGQLLVQYQEALRRTTSLHSGLRGRALEARVRQLTGDVHVPAEGVEPSAAEFDRALLALNQAFQKVEDHAHSR